MSAPASPGKKSREGGDEKQGKANALTIDEDELIIAWDFFDQKGTGKITAGDVKRRLSCFYKNISSKEIKFLLNNQPEITFQDFYSLLSDNNLPNFDPVKEAFKVYDPQGTGYVDLTVIKDCFSNLGYGDVSDEDMKIIVDTADADKDGKIGLEDFRRMVPFGRSTSTAAPTEAQKPPASP